MDGQQHLDQLRREFPDLTAELDEESAQGLLYVQLGIFARHAQRAIDSGAREDLERCLAAMDQAWRAGDDDPERRRQALPEAPDPPGRQGPT